MTEINIPGSNHSPEIIFSLDTGVISISGKSYPENVHETFKELFEAIEIYCSEPLKNTTVNFRWLYYNTATSKIIVKILLKMSEADTNLCINWYCKKDFNMMIEKAEVINTIMEINMNIIEN